MDCASCVEPKGENSWGWNAGSDTRDIVSASSHNGSSCADTHSQAVSEATRLSNARSLIAASSPIANPSNPQSSSALYKSGSGMMDRES